MPLRAYLFGLVALFVVALGAGTFISLSAVNQAALKEGTDDASFFAQLGGSEVNKDVGQFQAAVNGFAANPGVAQLFVKSAGCTLTFSGVGVFATAHLEMLRPDGSVVCSSLTAQRATGRPYAGAAWLTTATTQKVSVAPIVDPVAGGHALAVAAPVPGHGVVAALVGIDNLGPALAQRFGGISSPEFLISGPGGSSVITRSIDSAKWIGASLTGTSFSATASVAEHADLDGTVRLYAQSPIPAMGWTVNAGVSKTSALAAEAGLAGLYAGIMIGSLVAMVGAVILVSRRISKPIRELSRAVRVAATEPHSEPIDVPGPTEVGALASDFNEMMAVIQRELDERNRAEEVARESEHNYRLLFDANPLAAFVTDVETLRYLEVNDSAVEKYGYSREEFQRMKATEIRPAEDIPALLEAIKNIPDFYGGGRWRHIKKDGTLITVEAVSVPTLFRGRPARLTLVEDITEREQFERRLQQSQRLESLGHLAGGVAHDFNNLLAVILNYASFVEAKVGSAATLDGDQWGMVHADIEQIRLAAERAARLTHQLLAFTSREVVHPRVVNLNDVVGDIETLLRKTIGEDIHLEMSLAPELLRITADPGKLEQVLVNLAINARDAMPVGGTLAIETSCVEADKEYCVSRPGLSPGTYVSLRVSDTGSGMDRNVLAHAFEPFYSTKQKEQGTGLGLATVHGIVNQCGGVVYIYSELGLGTTVSALFPASESTASERVTVTASPSLVNGETILVVEDEAPLLEVTSRVLSGSGYNVLAATTAQEALALANAHGNSIDLLLTDVVMPDVQGGELAAAMTSQQRDLRVLFMSGYAQPVLTAHGTLGDGVSLIEKPFTAEALLAKVREVLDLRRVDSASAGRRKGVAPAAHTVAHR